MDKELSDQIAELQLLLMDQQQTMDDFSAQLIKFGDRLETAESRITDLGDRLQQLAASPATQSRAADETPPHY